MDNGPTCCRRHGVRVCVSTEKRERGIDNEESEIGNDNEERWCVFSEVEERGGLRRTPL